MHLPDLDAVTHRSHRHSAFPAAISRHRGRTAIGLAVVGALAVGVLVPMMKSSSAEESRIVRGFESGTGGWVAAGTGASANGDTRSHSGHAAARLTSETGAKVELRDRPNLVPVTRSRTRYVASVWVKASRASGSAVLRLREIKGGTHTTVSRERSRIRLTDTGWHQIVTRITPDAGNKLGIAVVGHRIGAGQSLLVDRVAVRVVRTAKAGAGFSRGKTMFGLAYWPKNGESNDQALARADRTLGRSQIIRIFYPGLPVPWPGAAGRADRPVVVSFKAKPQDILAGRYDSTLKSWFANAPRNRQILWTYYHEPEDNIERGEFTAAQYRAAWKKLRGFADAAHNRELKATLVLMEWSLRKGSGRNWRDYYPGKNVIDVLGWDAYNYGAFGKSAARAHSYDSPASIYSTAVKVSKAEGKPFGFAEWGSLLVPGDSGTRRAAWISASMKYFAKHGAMFATYFDTPVAGEYRLNDAPSQAALRSAITSAG